MAYANSVGGWDYSRQKTWDRELARYRDLKAQGVEPEGTSMAAMDRTEATLEAKS